MSIGSIGSVNSSPLPQSSSANIANRTPSAGHHHHHHGGGAAATSAGSLLSALTDPSSSQDSTATLAGLAGDSDLWQGINTAS
jgi:hypothetical protein